MSARENVSLEFKIICATNVSHTNLTDKMDVYAVVSIIGDDSQTQAAKTPTDNDGGTNPTWNHPVKFSVNEKEAHEGLLTVNVKLYSYWLEGSVDLLMTLPVEVKGETEAKLSLSYRFKRELAGNMYPSLSDYSSSDSGRTCPDVLKPQQFQSPMTKLTLELVIKMAKDIKDVSWIHGMDIYASVTVREGKLIKHRSDTSIAFGVYKYPIWDHAIRFSFDESLARGGRLTLVVQLINHRTIRGDKEMGEVAVPILELLSSYMPSSTLVNGMKMVNRDVIGPSGKVGTLSFTYRFLDEQEATIPPAPPQPTTPPTPPTTTPQPFIIYIPIPHQPFGSPNPVHEASTSFAAVHLGAHPETSSGILPAYIQPSYQSHGHQQFPTMPPH
ncbi:hypothetical protein Bca101_014264 [Brassica carinata]